MAMVNFGEMDVLGQWFNYRIRSCGFHSLLSIMLYKLYLLTKNGSVKKYVMFYL